MSISRQWMYLSKRHLVLVWPCMRYAVRYRSKAAWRGTWVHLKTAIGNLFFALMMFVKYLPAGRNK